MAKTYSGVGLDFFLFGWKTQGKHNKYLFNSPWKSTN